MLISNFQAVGFPSIQTCEQKWFYLEKELRMILVSERYRNSLEELYKTAEDLHIARYAFVVSNFGSIIKTYLEEVLANCLLCCDNILVVFLAFWKKFRQDVMTFKNIFLRFDSTTRNFKHNLIQSICFGYCKAIILSNSQIRAKLLGEMLAEIELERHGFGIDQNLIKSSIEMLTTLHIYDDFFEEVFLETTDRFYQKESRNVIRDYPISQYMKHVRKRLNQEQERIRNYLELKTEQYLLNIIYFQFIEQHMNEILTKKFDDLLEDNMYEDLSLTYRLFQKVENGIANLVKHFQKYIITKGTTITDIQNDKKMIQDLLDFKDNLETIIRKSFENQPKFHESIRSAFKKLINVAHVKSAHLLAKFIDGQMRCSFFSDDDLESILSKLLSLFKHLQSKDIFLAFYEKFLAKRLLLGKSTNQDAENNMISKLKAECGNHFTSNLEGMFQDMNLSRLVNLSFKQKLDQQDSEFNVSVLTNSFWPSFPRYSINLPSELTTYQDRFQEYYLSKHNGRKLLWQPNLSYCLVQADFVTGSKELQISLFQAVILLLFNTHNKLLLKEIQEASGLEYEELKRTILSLTGGKAKVLTRTPKRGEIEQDDSISINEQFNHKLYRVKINQIQLQETPEEDQKTHDHVVADRQFQIDAAIVRIMKTSKTLAHSLLLQELYNLLEIPITQADVKKRIEVLIEREYIKRDVDNKSIYIYVA